MGLFKPAVFSTICSRESALFIAEKFTLHQGLGQSAAIDGHERLITAPAQVMNPPGDQLLACSAGALNDDGHARRSDNLDLSEDLLSLGTSSHDLFNTLVFTQ